MAVLTREELKSQLQRRLTSDILEQSWYWIDLANGLRNLNREQSLPHLLRCAEAGGDHISPPPGAATALIGRLAAPIF